MVRSHHRGEQGRRLRDSKQRVARSPRLEVLERCELLTIGPTVAAVEVGSTQWSPGLIDRLRAGHAPGDVDLCRAAAE